MSYFYIASPYSHIDTSVMADRYWKAVDFTSWVIEKYRMHVFSPIVHSHPLCVKRNLRPEAEYWMALDYAMLEPARGLIVFQIEGWDLSKGVKLEMEYQEARKRPVLFSKEMWPNYNHSMEVDDYVLYSR